jgi:hypothetical protein
MTKTINLLLVCLLLLGVSCHKETEEVSYQSCNGLLSNCAGSSPGEYCTFGFKWGDDNPFSAAGPEVAGPGVSGGEISYNFAEAGEIFNTHSQVDVESVSIDRITACYPREAIRQALAAWESVADITFKEVPASEKGQLRFIVANITQGGIGYPAFTDDLCSSIAGQVVINATTRNTCEGFQNLVLHEIGHALGLGHVSTDNVMNPGVQHLTDLMPGDIEGIQSIYGAK